MSHNHSKFHRYVEFVRTNLRLAVPGARVVTCHGFGGEMPLSYELVKKEPIGSSSLDLWVKLEMPSSFRVFKDE